MPRAIFRSLLVLPLACLLATCGESTGPGPQPGAPAPFVGSYEPDGTGFVLERSEVTAPWVTPVPVELVGSNVEVDTAHALLSLDVTLRNAGNVPLYGPAIVWVSDFVPSTVHLSSWNVVGPKDPPQRFGLDYTDLLGGDLVLMPQEESEPYRWRFYDPGLQSFSFGAEVEMHLEPVRASISGGVFDDLNQDGVRQRNEPPWTYGMLRLKHPDGYQQTSLCDEVGAFRFLIDDPGLYTLTLESMVDCIVCFTTPNPLEVLIVEDEEGVPISFGMAIFGATMGFCDDPPGEDPGA